MPEIKLYNGDCLDIMRDIPDRSVDMVLCDLPYGMTKAEWDTPIDLDRLWSAYSRVTKDDSAICLFAVEPFASKLRLSNLKMYKYDWVWDKIKSTGFLNANKQPLRGHEVICVFYKDQCTYNPQKSMGHPKKSSTRSMATDLYGKADKLVTYESTERYPRSILSFSSDVQKSALHPTQKPVALLEYLIKTYTNEGDTVLDNCMGSGSTGVACKLTGRNFIGVELGLHYFNVAKDRIENTQVPFTLF